MSIAVYGLLINGIIYLVSTIFVAIWVAKNKPWWYVFRAFPPFQVAVSMLAIFYMVATGHSVGLLVLYTEISLGLMGLWLSFEIYLHMLDHRGIKKMAKAIEEELLKDEP